MGGVKEAPLLYLLLVRESREEHRPESLGHILTGHRKLVERVLGQEGQFEITAASARMSDGCESIKSQYGAFHRGRTYVPAE